MKPRHWLFGLLVGVIAGLALVGDRAGQPALAQQNPQQSANGRFQISAWALGGPPARSGCYMVDTATGELWVMEQDGNICKWVKKVEGLRRPRQVHGTAEP